MISFFKNSNNFYAIDHKKKFQEDDIDKLSWLLNQSEYLINKSLEGIFIGPRKEMTTPWSTNAVEICKNVGINSVNRIEKLSKDKKDFDEMLESKFINPGQDIFKVDIEPQSILYIDNIKNFNKDEGLALSEEEIEYLDSISQNLGRKLTDSEVFGFSQVNSEHCRHKIFNGEFIINDRKKDKSLFQMIKSTSKSNSKNLISAYKDNVAFIKGPKIEMFTTRNKESSDFYYSSEILSSISLKAETHNFPTTVEPFSGAATGSGGEIRDRMAGGQASIPLAGTAVYMTSYPRTTKSKKWEKNQIKKKWLYQHPKDILIKASNGASDYGNKFGQPLICGSLLTFEHNEKELSYGYDKVIMLAGGVGYGKEKETKKKKISEGDLVVVMGGDNYRIGMGGSSVSSVNTGELKNKIELNAVQRSNPEMQKRVANVIRALSEEIENPILSIHDHGAGGHLNCLSELLEDTGGEIDIHKLPIGDPTLSEKEIIGNESQERMGIIIKEKDFERVLNIAKRERAPIYLVGKVKENKKLVFKGKNKLNPIDLSLKDFFGSSPKTIITDKTVENNFKEPVFNKDLIIKYLENVLSLESVACKDWLTNKVDRCVTGKVALQQTVGEIQLPLNNLGVMALDFKSNKGIATSLGFAPVTSLVNEKIGAKYSLLKALTNIIWAPSKSINDISLSANWMWPANNLGENTRLYNAVKSLSDFAISLGMNIPTGKDSLSMTQKYPNGEKVLSPGTVIISAVSEVENINKVVKPKLIKNLNSKLIYINLCEGFNLAGSAFYQTFNCVGNKVIETIDHDKILRIFSAVQKLIKENKILSGHDISSGGLITSLLEMNFPNKSHGIKINLDKINESNIIDILFNESPGIILQVHEETTNYLKEKNINFIDLGSVINKRKLLINKDKTKIQIDIDEFRDTWYKTSYLLDKEQTEKNKSKERLLNYKNQPLAYSFPNNFSGKMPIINFKKDIRAAVIREKGINSEREMAYMLHISGFKVKDVHMTDLISGRENLEDVNMIVFPGGFSNSDVLGSAKGWAGAFKFNKKANHSIKSFYERENTLSLGVCNGCQLMMELDLIYPNLHENHPKMKYNSSNKFECVFTSIDIMDTNSIMLKNMSGSTLGIWSAHGEGRFDLKNNNIEIAAKFHYEDYPGNPNGSDQSTAAVCSEDGRHLAMMPHLERTIFPWNWAHYDSQRKDEISPWIMPFINARKWLEENA